MPWEHGGPKISIQAAFRRKSKRTKTETLAFYEGFSPTWLRRRPYTSPDWEKLPTKKKDFLLLEGKPKFEGRNEEQRERVGQPPTPLVTKRELTEENDLWEDQKILSQDPRSSWGKKPERNDDWTHGITKT